MTAATVALLGAFGLLAAGAGSPTNPSPMSFHAVGARFRDCPQCPEMVAIPPGRFTMTRKRARDGRKDDDPEGVSKSRPAREVDIEKAFALGRYPITRQEFGAFVRDTHRAVEKGCHVMKHGVWILDQSKDWKHPGFQQSPRDPVICVSWNDAQDYVQWLNSKVRGFAQDGALAGPYRLPGWEEIEYAAGGGTKSPYYWGARAQRTRANYGAERCLPCRPTRKGADRWLYTSPVGKFPPNPFGLYDMAGNVWQWARTCQSDSKAIPPKVCPSQALHGGSWLTNPEYMRTGNYSSADVRHRNYEIGFRLARTLN